MVLDLARFSETAEHLDTLSPTDAEEFLQALSADDSDLSAALGSWSARKERARSFLQTSAPFGEAAAAPRLAKGGRVGAWEVAELLGSGGMGEVYKAHRADGGFDQLVALKLARASDASFALRFENERQRLARLDHPGIARIVDGGESADGSPYMTMEFVDGEPVTDFARSRGLDRAGRLALVGQLCAALSHAHSRLILHCDIKPDNVMVNQDGIVRLVDFGVASLIGEDEDKSGALTLAFAAPEQLKRQPVSTATDVFAVGVLIHLLETGKLPKRQPDGGVQIDDIALGDKDLAAIIGKATAADAEERYSSVGVLAEDITEFRGGFPVSARQLTPMSRFTKAVMRNKLASTLGAGAFAALIAGVIGVTIFALKANQEAEANRITQEAGALQIELYETFGAGFAEFVASIDPESAQGQALFAVFEDLEKKTRAFENQDPQKALQNYVFLSEIYADSGRDRDASRIAERLADSPLDLTYAHAFTWGDLVHLSEGYVPTDTLLQWQDRLFDYWRQRPDLNGFEMAINRCVRARLSIQEIDQRACLDRAEAYLAENQSDEYTVRSANLGLQAYAASVALALKDAERGRELVRNALSFFENEDRPSSVPEVVFWMHLSDFDQMSGEWRSARKNLEQAEKSIEGKPQFGFYAASIDKEMAETELALKRFEEAERFARRSYARAVETFGPDQYQARDAQVQIGLSLAGQGKPEEAREIIEGAIKAEIAATNDKTTLDYYRKMLASVDNG